MTQTQRHGAPAARPGDPPASGTMALAFRLDGEAFGVVVDRVNEILDPQTPTPVPNAGPFAGGLINVRGVVVPVLDLRWRLGLAPGTRCQTSRFIVLEHEIDGAPTRLAFEADAVEEVIEVDPKSLERVPDLGARWPQVFLRGAIRRDDDLVILLDTTTLFSPETEEAAA